MSSRSTGDRPWILPNASKANYGLHTIFTLLTTFQKQMRKLDQPYTVVTFDKKIYCFAKEIQWKYTDMFDDLVIRLGGMHILITFQAVIGKMFAESRLEDLLN